MQLPLVLAELVGDGLDPSDVVLVGEVRAEDAAAEVGLVRVDAVAPAAEDAGPRRGEPREVAAEALVVLARVLELGQCAPSSGRSRRGAGECHRSRPSPYAARPHGPAWRCPLLLRLLLPPCALVSSISVPTPSICSSSTPTTVRRRSLRRPTRSCCGSPSTSTTRAGSTKGRCRPLPLRRRVPRGRRGPRCRGGLRLRHQRGP